MQESQKEEMAGITEKVLAGGRINDEEFLALERDADLCLVMEEIAASSSRCRAGVKDRTWSTTTALASGLASILA